MQRLEYKSVCNKHDYQMFLQEVVGIDGWTTHESRNEVIK
jgi:hypothetical protein